jgi:hypothetical protein
MPRPPAGTHVCGEYLYLSVVHNHVASDSDYWRRIAERY